MRSVAVGLVVIGISLAATIHEGKARDCGCEGEPAQDAAKPAPRMDELDGNGVGAHDPSMAKEGRTYYMFCTGPGIAVRSSTDLKAWTTPSRLFEHVPAWTSTTIPGSRDFYWAPDISYFNHKWHLYYAVSTFGKNRSAIGLATNVTLDPKRPDYKWVDEGPAFQSYPADKYNAIDPNISFDTHGQPWLAFGSFWGGIKILKLNPETGLPADPTPEVIGLASRPSPDAIEAPFIVRHGRFFYLFASYDFCCRGVKSTYNVRVGRSASITGPYVDKDGKPLMEDGGTQILATHGRWHGPGGNSVLHDGRQDLIVYHAYDAQANGAPRLRIAPIVWTRDGWPTVPPAQF